MAGADPGFAWRVTPKRYFYGVYDDALGELDLRPAVVSNVTLQELQDRYILDVLEHCRGNISAAADQLGLFRSSLQRRMRKEPLASKARAVLKRLRPG